MIRILLSTRLGEGAGRRLISLAQLAYVRLPSTTTTTNSPSVSTLSIWI